MRGRHRDHYTAMAALLDTPADGGYERRIEQAEAEIDNLRAAFAWSRERSDTELALTLASALQPLWLSRGRIQEGLNWLGAALADDGPESADAFGCARAGFRGQSRCSCHLAGLTEEPRRGRADPGSRTGTRRPCARGAGPDGLRAPRQRYDREVAGPFFAEATELARELGDSRSLAQITRPGAGCSGSCWTNPPRREVAAEEGLRIAEDIGDGFVVSSVAAMCWAGRRSSAAT